MRPKLMSKESLFAFNYGENIEMSRFFSTKSSVRILKGVGRPGEFVFVYKELSADYFSCST